MKYLLLVVVAASLALSVSAKPKGKGKGHDQWKKWAKKDVCMCDELEECKDKRKEKWEEKKAEWKLVFDTCLAE